MVGIVLGIILAVALALRVAWLDQSPPGLNQDEADNAWNAWCLLHTGTDQTGASWPLLYIRALGENRSAIHLYAIIPFQALGGLNVWTTRLPFALAGVVTVALVYLLMRRLCGPVTGILAAAFVATNSWHITLSRLGFEAALSPFYVCLAVLAVLWAGFPPISGAIPRPAWATFLAGLVGGGVCFGYAAVRLFLPIFLLVWLVANWPAAWAVFRTRKGLLRAGAFTLGVAATFGPLVYHHLEYPDVIGKRAEQLWLWNKSDPVSTRIGLVLARYAAHYGPDFLFVSGDHSEMQSPHGFGVYAWYLLPLSLAGLARAFWRFRREAAARILLVWFAVYPAGDCLNRHVSYRGPDFTLHNSLHALRSSPGLVALPALAAYGAAGAYALLRRGRPKSAIAATVVTAALMVALDARFVRYFLVEHPRRPEVRRQFQVDLVAACAWLKPHSHGARAVVVTLSGMNMPYVVMLVSLNSPVAEWFDGPREMHTTERGWDLVYRTGRLYFLYARSVLTNLVQELRANDTHDRVYLLMRPGEWTGEPVYTVLGPDQKPSLCIFEAEF